MKLPNITRDFSGQNKIIAPNVMASKPRNRVMKKATLISLFLSHAFVARVNQLRHYR